MNGTKDGFFAKESVMAEEDGPEFRIERPVYLQDELNRNVQYTKPSDTALRTLKRKARGCCSAETFWRSVPVLRWLPEYRWKTSFVGDLISGMTVAVMHIPQGMAYALLGNVPPIVGIYMAFFPVLVYFLFGSSRHVSMGTFAVICLMTGKVVLAHTVIADKTTLAAGDGNATTQPVATAPAYTEIEVASTVTFTVAIIQLVMWMCRLGVVASLLSETLVAGFTCAAAFQVFSTQMKDLLGLPVQKRRGFFSFPLTIYDVVMNIPNANRAVLAVSLVSCVVLGINDEIFKPWLKKKTRIPFPIELFAVVIGTATSYFMNFEETYNISIVGDIPTGLPVPTLPRFELMPSIVFDSFLITVVSYTVTMSMALIFAQKQHYEVDANQELLALSMSNGVGAAFSCMPISASLSRSMIQETVGGVTQLASVVSCTILLFVLLWVGPCFEKLPRCVLASIIVMALRAMLMKVRLIVRYWRLSKWDALVWLSTFFTTAFVNISVGLGVGVLLSLVSLFVQGYTPYTCLMGVVPNTDIYMDFKRYKGTEEIPGIRIFHYSGGLSFASKGAFRNTLYRRLGFDPVLVLSERLKLKETNGASGMESLNLRCLVLDFSALTFVDPAGVQLLRQLQSDYADLGVDMYLACCSSPVFETIKKCDKYEKVDSSFMVFPSIHDAVLYAKTHLFQDKGFWQSSS